MSSLIVRLEWRATEFVVVVFGEEWLEFDHHAASALLLAPDEEIDETRLRH